MNTFVLRADTTVRAVLRRRLAVVVLVAMPVAFYFVRHDSVGQSVRALVFGISWAVSIIAFFATVSARRIEPRLVLAGWRRTDLVVGRLIGLVGLVVVLTVAFAALVGLDQDVRSVSAVALDFAITGAVAVGIGTTVGTAIGKEMEGIRILFFLAGLQAIANPFDAWSRALPFWSSRELGPWAIDGPGAGSLGEGLVHALIVIGICSLIVWLDSVRLRVKPLRFGRPRPSDNSAG